MIDFARARDPKLGGFDFIRTRLASPEEIRGWSHGQVVKPETINYRSYKPEHEGLFCERIFGPVKDWECHCGKFKRIRYRGHVCDRCGVEVTLSRVRRERMGHIELAVPVVHLWFFKSLPSQLGNLLGITLKELERVVYYSEHVVVHPGRQNVEYMELLDDDDLYELEVRAELDEDTDFKAESGAEAVRTLLKQIDAPPPKRRPFKPRNADGRGLDRLAKWLREEIRTETSQHRRRKKLKRLKLVEELRSSGPTPDQRNKPEWVVMEVIPVIPPDLRPLVPLDGGRFATSDLNDLYRRVINRNNRLKKLIDMGAPEVILRNEKRMLQESVDALFDNGRRGKAIKGRGARPLKSLSDMLKGKQGRFRQNLLGKRVDYSGRSVIVVGPELKLHQCGLPKTMAVELFKPFIIRELERRGEAETVKRAKKIVEDQHPKVYEVLEDIIRDHPVLLNRAPTLHRLSIQAFEPVLVEGKAIRIHPLVCAAFNADFDGDQMAVHVPLSYEAQLEARVLMLSSNNILLPSNGRPIVTPSQDMVIGAYYLTNPGKRITDLEASIGAVEIGQSPPELEELYRNAPRFSSYAGIEMALADGRVEHRTPVWYLFGGDWLRTTVGRVLFNSIVPDDLGFLNRTFGKKELGNLVFDVFRRTTMERTREFLDALKDLGFRYATLGGISIGVVDLEVPGKKGEIIEQANARVARFQGAYDNGFISDGERYNKVIDTWTHANNDLAEAMTKHQEASRDGFNPVHMMMRSGARGNLDQMRQLAGMRGLMAKPQKKLTGGMGEIIESPIRSNFREGLTVVEYFLSTHGARKGLADTALKTADAGYLTRRLVDVAQDVTVTEYDCGTVDSVVMTALKDGEEVVDSLAERIAGTVAAEDVLDPLSGKLLVKVGGAISDLDARHIENAGIEEVRVRSVLTCRSVRGVCCMCYGRNLATMDMIDVGEAVGILAAQSIGEPGTQLTLRTFHIGGASGRIAEQSQRLAKVSGTVRFNGVSLVGVGGDQEKGVVTSREGEIFVTELCDEAEIPAGAFLMVGNGDAVRAGDRIYRLATEVAGTVGLVREERGEEGTVQVVRVLDKTGAKEVARIPLPKGARPVVKDGQSVNANSTVAEFRHLAKAPAVVFIENVETAAGGRPAERVVVSEGGRVRIELRNESMEVPYGAVLTVEDGQQVTEGTFLFTWDPYHRVFLAEQGGVLKLFQVHEGDTFRRELDEATGRERRTIIRHRPTGRDQLVKHPVIYTVSPDEPSAERIVVIPKGAEPLVADGQEVAAGDKLAETRGVVLKGGSVRLDGLLAVPPPHAGASSSQDVADTPGPGWVVIGAGRESTDGKVPEIVIGRNGADGFHEVERHAVPPGAVLDVVEGVQVEQGDRLYRWNPDDAPVITMRAGRIKWIDLEKGVSYRDEGGLKIVDRRRSTISKRSAVSGSESAKEGEPPNKPLNPRLEIIDENGAVVEKHRLVTGARLEVDDEDFVGPGQVLVRSVHRKARPYKSKGMATVTYRQVTSVPSPDGGDRHVVITPGGSLVLKGREGDEGRTDHLAIPVGALLRVADGSQVKVGDTLFETDPYAVPVVAPIDGIIDFGEDASAGTPNRFSIREKIAELHPQDRSQLEPSVEDGARVNPGQVLAKFSREEFRTRDITGGLPRVTELFEGRRPKDPAVITKIDGIVEFGDVKRAKREVRVRPEHDGAKPETYLVPVGKHLRVQQGDRVREGDRLSEGSIDPHDLLVLSEGRRKVQEYILREVLDVYRLQGVKINEKHIAVIVRQMLRRVRVTDSGDTELLEGDTLDHAHVLAFNERARNEGKRPARTAPLLLGITKAALTTDSFVSSASFQETTRVLTDASLRGARDDLAGLKENIIIGQLVPAGTGVHRHHEVEFVVTEQFYDEEIEPLLAPDDIPSLLSPALRAMQAVERAEEVREILAEETDNDSIA